MIIDGAIYALEEYSERPEPKDETAAEIRAYEDWALGELYYRIMDHPDEYPECVIYRFCSEMAMYSGIEGIRDRTINPFLIAYDVGVSIIRMIDHPRED